MLNIMGDQESSPLVSYVLNAIDIFVPEYKNMALDILV